MTPGTGCPLCRGAGEVLREDRRNNDRLFAWPCPADCAPGGPAVVRSTVSPERAAKAARKMDRSRPEVMAEVAARWREMAA